MWKMKLRNNNCDTLLYLMVMLAMIRDSGSNDTKGRTTANDGVAMYTNELYLGSRSNNNNHHNDYHRMSNRNNNKTKLPKDRYNSDYPDYNADYDNLPLHIGGISGLRKVFLQQQQQLVQTREVTVKQGRIKGLVRLMHPQSGIKNVDQFLGIPYAEAPVGRLRFMPPG